MEIPLLGLTPEMGRADEPPLRVIRMRLQYLRVVVDLLSVITDPYEVKDANKLPTAPVPSFAPTRERASQGIGRDPIVRQPCEIIATEPFGTREEPKQERYD